MRSFSILLGLAAIASPLVSAKKIKVEQTMALDFVRSADKIARESRLIELAATEERDRDDDPVKIDLEDLRKLQQDVAGMLLAAGENPSLFGSPPTAPGAWDMPTDGNAAPRDSGVSTDTNAIVVPTVDDGLYNGVGGEFPPVDVDTSGATAAVGQTSCTNQGSECNKFEDFTKCWQVCVSSQKTKNPVGKGSDGKLPDCAKWCEDSCGCDKATSLVKDQGAPSDGATDVSQELNGNAYDRNTNWI